MNTQNKNQTGYMLLFIGTDWHKGLSPDQTQKAVGEMMAWFKRLSEEGKVVDGHPLDTERKVVSGKSGRVVDGPFAESKEAIGGYFMLDVATMDEAVAIAKQCPSLAHGVKVEVRAVLADCPFSKGEAEAQLAEAAA